MSTSESDEPPILQNLDILQSSSSPPVPAIVPPVQLLTLTTDQLTSLISDAVDAALQRRIFSKALEHDSDTSSESDMHMAPH